MKPFLTQQEAIERAKRVEPKIHNQLFLKLEKGENFSGIGKYTFELKATDGIFMDYCGKGIEVLSVNENEVSPADIAKLWTKGKINLPSQYLKVGTNSVRIHFSNVYYHDGNGIHSFIDTDGKQYTYCQSEPFWANKIYPVFDQPDLKSYMTYHITAPSDWEIVSNTVHEKKVPLNLYLSENRIKSTFENEMLSAGPDMFTFSGDFNLHVFKTTPLLSTYLHTFVAGPFKSIIYNNKDDKAVPMTIYCRESLYQFAVDQQTDIFAFCKWGIEFFNGFFRYPFPFEKYDFIFCPEFTVGAMEYPGAVTFNDKFIFREAPNTNQITTRGMVILHELAHFWFGDLVTMKWWNDLWLNESFADFMCYVALDAIKRKGDFPVPIADGWSMFQQRKTWGYNDDSDITTHPIAGIVDSTDKADSIFDGITYSKGASVLKQLYFLITPEKFSEALGNYFKKHEWANATLKDLLEEVKKVVKEEPKGPYDIDRFNKDWIETAGHTQFLAQWDSAKQGESELTIVQSPVLPDHATLRFHKIKIAFLKEDASVGGVLDVIVDNAAQTVVKFKNEGYKAVILNFEDWAFVKVELDAASRDFLLKNLHKVPEKEALTQLLALRSFNDMVRDAKLKGTDFTGALLPEYLAKVTDNALIFDGLVDNFNAALTVWTPLKFLFESSDKVFEKLVALAKTDVKPDIAKVLKGKILAFARSVSAIKVLKDIFEEADPALRKLQLTIEEQWAFLFKLHWHKDFSDKQRAIIRQYLGAIDKTDSKKYWERTLDAFAADEETAKKLWDELNNKDRKISYIEMQAVFRGLNSLARPAEARAKFHDQFFTNALNLIKTDQKVNAKTYIEDGFPQVEDFDYLIAKCNEVLGQLTAENEYFQIIFKKKVNLLQRRKAAFAQYK